MTTDEWYMSRCLELAGKGLGRVAPNPMVGAVIVCRGRIIGEGYHRRYGEAHAEVNAIRSVRQPELLTEATLYVNLEPCSHYGKTPPCAELIVRKLIPRVVIGQLDPFPQVAGRGIRMLREAGVEVTTDILREECEELNRRFLTFHQKHRPYILLKWAQSADGFIDRRREAGDGQQPVRFSGYFSRMQVHKMRAEEAAIMVGKRTELLDKPALNVRYWSGEDPARVIPRSDIPLSEQLFDMYQSGIQSLIVEGGSRLLQSFIDNDLWDEARVEVADRSLEGGVPAPILAGRQMDVQTNKKGNVFFYRASRSPKNL